MVMAIRVSNGRPLGEGDRNHFHHHWQRMMRNEEERPSRRQSTASLVLTLLPALACMQALQGYPGHRIIAWAGAAWLLGVGSWFYLRGAGLVPGRESASGLSGAPSAPEIEPMVRAQLTHAVSGEHLSYAGRNRPDASL